MKAINNIVYPTLLACALSISMQGCKEDTLVFPEQIVVDDNISVEDRGPVKQNSFAYSTDDDETIKFDLHNVDKERVKSIFFSVNQNGEKIETEITNFDDLYIIKNLPLRTVSDIEVWAIGLNNLPSQKYTYKVTPLPYAATTVSENIIFDWALNTGYLRVNNTTRAVTTLYYKIDNAASYTELVVPNPTMELDVEIQGLSRGAHTLSYYVTDAIGGQSKVFTKDFISFDIVKIPNTELSAEVSSIELGEGAGNGVAASLIDGNINSYWHTPWSLATNPAYPHWIILDLGKVRAFSGFEMIRRHNNTTGGFKTFTVEHSTDNVNWTILKKDLNFNSADSPAAFQRYNFDTTNTRYIRINITAPMGSVQSTHLAEINVFEIL